MTAQLLISGILGIATTAVAFYANRHLFNAGNAAGRVSLLEGIYYVVGVVSIVLGWYFNVRYTHTYHNANYWNYTKMLFTNWAADSAAQDYITSTSSSCRSGRSPTAPVAVSSGPGSSS